MAKVLFIASLSSFILASLAVPMHHERGDPLSKYRERLEYSMNRNKEIKDALTSQNSIDLSSSLPVIPGTKRTRSTRRSREPSVINQETKRQRQRRDSRIRQVINFQPRITNYKTGDKEIFDPSKHFSFPKDLRTATLSKDLDNITQESKNQGDTDKEYRIKYHNKATLYDGSYHLNQGGAIVDHNGYMYTHPRSVSKDSFALHQEGKAKPISIDKDVQIRLGLSKEELEKFRQFRSRNWYNHPHAGFIKQVHLEEISPARKAAIDDQLGATSKQLDSVIDSEQQVQE